MSTPAWLAEGDARRNLARARLRHAADALKDLGYPEDHRYEHPFLPGSAMDYQASIVENLADEAERELKEHRALRALWKDPCGPP